MAALMRSRTFSPPTSASSSASGSARRASSATAPASSRARPAKSSVRATKSVSQPSSSIPPAPLRSSTTIAPSLVGRPSRLPALASPRSRSSTPARPRSPPASARARLQSIMPAPLWSRSAFTAWAEISATLLLSSRASAGRDRAPRASALLAGALPRARPGDLGGLRRVRQIRLVAAPAEAGGTPPARRVLDLHHHAAAGRQLARRGGLPLLLGHLGAHALVEECRALEAGVGHAPAVEHDGADRVVVARDHVVDAQRIAVGVHHRHQRKAEALGLGDGDGLAVHVDHEDDVRQPLHRHDPFQRLAVLLDLAVDPRELLLRELGDLGLVGDLGPQLLEALDRLLDGLEVGQHAAEPAVVDVVLPAALGLELHRGRGLALGADE